jgi:hypothetical protein
MCVSAFVSPKGKKIRPEEPYHGPRFLERQEYGVSAVIHDQFTGLLFCIVDGLACQII